MLQDRYGNPVSTRSQGAIDKYNAALELIRLYRGDPIAALDAALEEDPNFTMAWAARAGVLVQQTDKAYLGEIDRSLKAGQALPGNERERAHLAAAQAWARGHMDDSVSKYARIAQNNPTDLFAVQTAHVGCFFTGRQQELRDGPLQALRAFKRDDDGYHALLGMAAFGLEECGDYARAEALGTEAVSLDPRDAWAIHAVAHVHEMRGDVERGVPWLRDSAQDWSPENGFAFHNWWHLALLHLDRGDAKSAITMYDTKVRPNADATAILECIDASALLWRLHLEGVGTGNRFAKLAACWESRIEDGHYAFNDLHAIMAFLGAGRRKDAERVLTAMRCAAMKTDDNAYMSRAVGIPLCEAFLAFDMGRFAETVEKIAAVRGIAQRFGGSHAQRDILSLTVLHAALRAGLKPTAEAFASERVAHKPESPWARNLAERARKLVAA
ncbi:tetratricopeptide repeat protein [Bradyrhizobium sp. LHD-71]|uniref:tetratricopeptide repeat protein n=1 Tax=Bradyrhizobium sp. LHD-71 TaxID=3072141 RepID=UPI00280EFF2F|nr:tetratricopeptide repeat protein [Bradyrhizobium sp. LHD-71]MDQ8728710.1 tetratricopeptide repeat protein [Bradyrhizobium sp. LHD-71]